jgi:uncharacterized protein YacL
MMKNKVGERSVDKLEVRSPRGYFVAFCAVVGAITMGISGRDLLEQLFFWISRQYFDAARNAAPESARQVRFEGYHLGYVIAMAVLGVVIGGVIGTVISRFVSRMGARWDRMATGDKVNLFLGIFAGIIAALPFSLLLQSFSGPNNDAARVIGPITTFLLAIGFSAMAVYALRSMEEVLPWYSAPTKPKKTHLRILDTNVIIDGRIYDVARTGFLDGQLYVPRFVLEELQHIADSSDALRRQRGRRGLDVLRLLQVEFPLEVGTYDKLAPDQNEEVDSRLVRLAKAVGGDLVTNDVNLNRVATLQKVTVLNLNDLSLALRPNLLPQEAVTLSVVREGNQPGQGIGYLEDGTMVIVENGRGALGQTVDVVVTQVIQTERGKLIFAELAGEPDLGNTRRKTRPQDA